MKIYMENKNKINKHNQRYHRGEVTYKLAMNKYGDLLHHEFVKHMNGFNRNVSMKYELNEKRFLLGVSFVCMNNDC